MAVDTTTYLADAKIIYGAIQDQVSTEAALINLFGDGTKFGTPINKIGIRGYTFLARLQPNWNMGYRPEGTSGVGSAGNQGICLGLARASWQRCGSNRRLLVARYSGLPRIIFSPAW